MRLCIFLALLLFLMPFMVLKAGDIPQELQEVGFTQLILIDYEEKDELEYFTFSDWKTEKSGDTVVFIVKDSKVKEWFKGPDTWGGEIIKNRQGKEI